MKALLALIITGYIHSSWAAEPTIQGVWQLDEWKVFDEKGVESEFCKGANGYLIYEPSGYVSTAINCPEKKKSKKKEVADEYERMFFYAGTYQEKKGTIYKVVSNSTCAALIGKTVLRKIEKVTDKELILTGPFGPKGSLWIRWTRK